MREKYEDLIEYVRYRTGTSRNRTWEILKQYSTELKSAIKRGHSVDIEGLVEISFTASDFIYQNSVYDLDKQVVDVSESLGLDEFEVRNVIQTYLSRIRDRLKDGYHVNIIGVCYMIPTEEGENVICTTRRSPVLEKPEVADFLMVTDRGIAIKELEGKDLRFRIDAKEEVEYLYTVARDRENQLSLQEVDI